MSIKEQLKIDMKESMRDKNTIALEAIRMLRADIQRKEVDEKVELNDDDVIAIIQKSIKQLNGAIEQFKSAGRQDLSDKDEALIVVLQKYLPAQLSDDEVNALIDDAIKQSGATAMQDMGKVMALLKPALQGKADMAKVGPQVKSKLS